MLLVLTGCVSVDKATGEPTGFIWNTFGAPMAEAIKYFATDQGLGFGMAIIIVTIIVRLIILPLGIYQSWKATLHSEKMNAERVPSTPSSVPKNPSCSSTVASGPGLTGVWSTVKGSRTCTCTMRLPASTYSSGNVTALSTTGKVSAGCQGAVSGHTHTPRFCCSVPVTVRVPPSRVTATGSVVSTSARVTEMRLLLLGSVHSRSMRPRDSTVVVETSFDTGTT